MADLNELHLLMGRALEGIENLERGVTGINRRLDQNVEPILDDYQKTKNQILGICTAVSAISGGIGAFLLNFFKHG